jgi:hypothetical protein
MPPYTAAQKQTIAQFVALTDTKDPVAAKVCVHFPRVFWGFPQGVLEMRNGAGNLSHELWLTLGYSS